MPPEADFRAFLLQTLGLPPDPAHPDISLGVSFRMIPQFEEKVLDHRDGHYLVQDWMGAIVEISDQYDYTYLREAKDFVTRKWHRFPVTGRAEWEEMRWRYDSRAPARFAPDFQQRCAALRDRESVVGINVNGPFWQLREWCGFEGLCVMMADDPDLVQEMSEFWTDFVSETLSPILSGVQLDYVLISEDMAFKEHSMISPAMARRFVVPAYQRWVPAIKASGCPIVELDSDGYIGDLLPIWIEAGINSTIPVEVAAGNDIVHYRQRFGEQIAYRGGIDKRALARGGEIMRAEVMRVVPPLLAQGGFIPGCDHGVPPDIAWPDFLDYARLLAQLTGWR